jgi:tetratricopeptide (TPR) repeat protein
MDEKEKAAGASGGVDIGGGQFSARDIIGRDQIVQLPPAPALSALHQFRPPVADFVGREREIQILVDALRAGDRVGLSGIQGLGGIGKSELARTVAQRLRDEYPDAQLWVDLRGTDPNPRPAADALAACIRAFVGPDAKLPEEQDGLVSIYLDKLHGQHALIVLDNAVDQAQVEPLLPPIGCAVLITSREAIAFPGLKRVTLEELPPPEARRLLKEIAPRLSDGLADEIGTLCGCLPLALRAAGSLLAVTPDVDPASYAKDLRHERTRLETIGTVGVNISVEASFNLSYSRLPSAARSVFRRLAVFPGSFDAQAEETVCEDPRHKLLSDLVRRSMVLYDTAALRYRLHDLVRVFADARLKVDERQAVRTCHAAHYMAVAALADGLYLRGGDGVAEGLRLFDREWGNIQAGQAWAAAHAGQDDEGARLCSTYPNAGVNCLNLRLHPRQQIQWREAALSAARHLKDRHAEGAHLGSLGNANAALGELRPAIGFHEQARVIYQELGDRRGEGHAMGNLGLAYLQLGELRRAIESYEQRLPIAREIGDRRGEGVALGNLGVAYLELGEPRHAIEFYEQHLSHCSGTRQPAGGGHLPGQLGQCLCGSRGAAPRHRVLRATPHHCSGTRRPGRGGHRPGQPG